MAAPALARTLTVTPDRNGIGAEVSGVDLAAPLSDKLVSEIERALVDYKVLRFRDQKMTSKDQLAFGRRFGALEIHPFAAFPEFSNKDEPELLVIESFPEKPKVAEDWHSDVTFRETPALGSILRITHCPEQGGDTRWADMGAAYEGLDDATRSFLSGLVAVHDWHLFRDAMKERGVPADQIAKLIDRFPPMEHPVLRTHPVSGEKLIYVNSNFTVRIKGMSETESNALLQRLYKLADIPDYQTRMDWKPGSVAFFDNRSTQHSVVPDVKGYRRLERVTIAGDRPF